MSALFADINKGEGVTAGLRKVTGACGGNAQSLAIFVHFAGAAAGGAVGLQ